MSEVTSSAVLEVFSDSNAGRLDFLNARTLAYSIPKEMDRLAKAVEAWQTAGKDGDGVDATLATGVGLWIMGQYQEAAEFLAALTGNADAFYFLGLCQTELGAYAEAIASLKAAAKAGQDAFVCAMAMAEAARRSGDCEAALDQVRANQEDHADEAELHYQKGRCLEDTMGYEEAMEALERAVELNPQHAGALFRLAYWHDLRGNDEQAIDYYEKAAEIRPARTNILLNLGILYEDHGQYEKAARLYDRVSEVARGNKRARMYVKDAQSSMNMAYDEAQERRQNRTAQLLRTPLSEFELSARSRSCLEKMNVRTVGDLVRLTEEELAQSKNFGETSLTELRLLLQAKGLRFGMGREEPAPPVGALAAPEQSGALATPIGELDLSVRSQKCMRVLGVQTVGDLVQKGERELLQCQNFGQTSLDEVREKLTNLGLELKS